MVFSLLFSCPRSKKTAFLLRGHKRCKGVIRGDKGEGGREGGRGDMDTNMGKKKDTPQPQDFLRMYGSVCLKHPTFTYKQTIKHVI